MPVKPKRAGPKRSAAREAATQPCRLYLRIRPALTQEEGGAHNVALQCDSAAKLAWVMGQDAQGDTDSAPRQFAFDHILEQHVGQGDLYDALGSKAVEAAKSGAVGSIICYGASGAGKEYSLRCERPGQEGLLPRALSELLPSATASTPRRLPRPGDFSSHGNATKLRIAYLRVTPTGALRDLLANAELEMSTARGAEGGGMLLSQALWEQASSATDVTRLLARGDAGDDSKSDTEHCHTLLLLRVGEGGLLLFATLASVDVAADSADIRALGFCLEAMGSAKQAPPVGDSLLTSLLAPVLGAVPPPPAQAEGAEPPSNFNALLLNVHPHQHKLPLTLKALQLGQLCLAGRSAQKPEVDYTALAAQLMAQRDAKQAALHELECEALVQLRPKLEEVMQQESHFLDQSLHLQQAQFEAKAFERKQTELQAQLEQQRQDHAPRMQALQAERTAIISQLHQELSAAQGSHEFASGRLQHEQDTEALGARLAALQNEVEAAEATLSTQEANSTKAATLLPAVARDLAALALTFTEEGLKSEAAAVFSHSLAVLEGAFGPQQPELANFKSEVHRVVAGQRAAHTGDHEGDLET